MHQHWIAQRTSHIEVSGIRKVFELARTLKDPIDLSIGQPDFDVPQPIKKAAQDAIERGKNAYTISQGIPELRTKIQAELKNRYGHADREVMITSGSTGGLLLALLATVDPGDEVIVLDPYFVLYPHLIRIAGGSAVFVDTYPGFDVDVDKVRSVITSRTKAIFINSPCNPTGMVYSSDRLRDLAMVARERQLLLLSDEIYESYCYDSPFHSPAEFNEDVLVFDGFSKKYGMTGWRLGYAHGPKRLIEEMTKLQQFTFVCPPSVVQHAGVAALNYDPSATMVAYRRKRDLMVEGLGEKFDLAFPKGAFYVFPRAPWGTGTEFVAEAIRNDLLAIPGCVFSRRDTHFRLSFAAPDRDLQRGIEVLNRLAAGSPTRNA
jgi:aspartate/methionine/tyrosine aminotransferase